MQHETLMLASASVQFKAYGRRLSDYTEESPDNEQRASFKIHLLLGLTGWLARAVHVVHAANRHLLYLPVRAEAVLSHPIYHYSVSLPLPIRPTPPTLRARVAFKWVIFLFCKISLTFEHH